MSFDALMRWEWEGGAPASIRDRDEAAQTKPAKNMHVGSHSQATNRRQKPRRATSVSPPPFERWQGDDSQR
jgi:hypothetical protein